MNEHGQGRVGFYSAVNDPLASVHLIFVERGYRVSTHHTGVFILILIKKYTKIYYNVKHTKWSCYHMVNYDIWNDVLLTLNNLVWSWVRWFVNDFHKWYSRMKINGKLLANQLTEKSSFTLNLELFYVLWFWKQTSVSHFSIFTKHDLFWYCDVARTWSHGIVK